MVMEGVLANRSERSERDSWGVLLLVGTVVVMGR